MSSQQSSTATAPRARKRRMGQRLADEERAQAQALFLGSFARNANVTAACKHAGIERSTLYKWKEHDEQFLMRYNVADQEAVDVIRAAIHTRSINGWLEPVVSAGRVVMIPDPDGPPGAMKPLMVRKFDTALTLALARARVAEYRERVDLNVQGGVSHEHRIIEDDPEAAGIARALVRRLTAGSSA